MHVRFGGGFTCFLLFFPLVATHVATKAVFESLASLLASLLACLLASDSKIQNHSFELDSERIKQSLARVACAKKKNRVFLGVVVPRTTTFFELINSKKKKRDVSMSARS